MKEDILIVSDGTLRVWEFRAYTEKAKVWLSWGGASNLRKEEGYDLIVLHDYSAVAAMRQAAEAAKLTVTERAGKD